MATAAVELASAMAAPYAALPGLRMVLLTGSAARSLADESSDLDVHMVWDVVDRARLGAIVPASGATRLFGVATPDGCFEKHRHEDRLVDLESVGVDTLEAAVQALGSDDALTDGVAALAAGMRDAIALVGAAELRAWQARLVYADAVAVAEAAARGRRLLAPSALYDLTYARGDVLSFAAARVRASCSTRSGCWRQRTGSSSRSATRSGCRGTSPGCATYRRMSPSGSTRRSARRHRTRWRTSTSCWARCSTSSTSASPVPTPAPGGSP